MPTPAAIPLFLSSLAITLAAARVLARRLDRLGVRFGFPESLIGLLTALAADGPEISSAIVALAKGDRGISVGIVVGSNAFNLAAMVGLSALLVGGVRLAREALLLEALIAVLITLLAGAVLMRWLAPEAAAGIAGCAIVLYLALVVGGHELLAHRAMPERLASRLRRALASRSELPVSDHTSSNHAPHLVALVVVDVALIIGGSFGMVQAAVSLGGHWHVSQAVLGVIVLAPLTSVPNAFTGIRLGLARRGTALVGETFNSNTINLAAGVVVPALFTTLVALTSTAKLQLAWLVAMTLLAIALLAGRHGMRRWGGAVLVLSYCGFVLLLTT